MINCKRHIISAGFIILPPFTVWSDAPVVDDSDNFAQMEEQQAYDAPVVNPKYDEPQIAARKSEIARNDNYDFEIPQDDGPALVKEDTTESKSTFNDNAKLIDKIQSLQQEVQELRGQLEVQAHDLKLLQQQQIAFYKDLDTRLGSASVKSVSNKVPTEVSKVPTKVSIETKVAAPQGPDPVAPSQSAAPDVIPVSRINPADEQISYMAAYELIKSKHYEDATHAMQIFVQKYPNGGYTANAEYWLGELFLVKKDYPMAIEHFDVVLKKFPSSSKSAASMLKSGFAYASAGNNSEAKQRLQQVVKTYPGTPTAKLASSKLKTINAL